LKHDPPKPMLAFRNLEPILESALTAPETSVILACVFSQTAEILFMEETLCASIAFATSLDSSLLQTLVVRIFSLGTQCAYTSTRA